MHVTGDPGCQESGGGLHYRREGVPASATVRNVFRCLIDEDIPLNGGVLHPVKIILPECLLNPPERYNPADCAAVVVGNVETSQRVVDVLLSQGSLQKSENKVRQDIIISENSICYL